MKNILTGPVTYEQIRDLRIGDTVYYTGLLATCRDAGHGRVIREGILPARFSFRDQAVYHAGPIIATGEDGKRFVVSAGPTTSRRMEALEADFIEKTGVRLIIGKGGMLEKTENACKEHGAVHCAFPGGCAVVAAQAVEEVVGVEWEDFGMAEALWVLRVKEFGPLIVSIDTKGNNLFAENARLFRQKIILPA